MRSRTVAKVEHPLRRHDARGTFAEQRVQMRLDTPQRWRLQPGWRRHVAAQHLEELADKTFRRPVGQPDATSGPTHTRHFRSTLRMVGREHHAEGRDHRVEARVFERQCLGVGGLKRNVEPLGLRPLGTAFEQRGDVVGRRHLAAAARRGQRGVAVAGGHIEHPLVSAQVAGFGQLLADDLQGGADDGVIAAGPRGFLAALEGIEVDGGVHIGSPLRRPTVAPRAPSSPAPASLATVRSSAQRHRPRGRWSEPAAIDKIESPA